MPISAPTGAPRRAATTAPLHARRRAPETAPYGPTPFGAFDTTPLGAALPWMKRPPVRRPGLHTTGQVAAALGVSERTVRDWCARGRLHSEVLPSGHRRIPAQALEVFRAGGSYADQVRPRAALEAAREAFAAIEKKLRTVSQEELVPTLIERTRLEMEVLGLEALQ